MARRLEEIVARFGGQLRGDGKIVITGLAPLQTATESELSFLAHPKYRRELARTRAAAVILAPEFAAACPVAAIVTPQPYLYFARVSQWLAPPPPEAGIHPSAVVESPLPASVSVGAHCWVGRDVEIGEGSILYAGVKVYPGCRIGRRVIIHAGAVIGADGFGFAQDGEAWVKIAQTGRVVIGDDVEIGANTTIDRGALDDTVIEEGVKLDNQIQIAHNVRIGRHTAIAGCVGIAGSSQIGARCTIGGGAIILGHLRLADGVHVSAGTLIAKSIATPGSYTGTVPAAAHEEWRKNFAHLRHLDALADRIRALEARLAELEKK
ncbi:MAG: UDP-3-O-(3-hydroxymyristoyl)glucosamine N-acyltransferase [Rhodocyclaceae bacterium]|nr:UDP-3-O-(3-hydroxymyristoyl)glucosamine N-acyltransferase [Rhodocyclaceae bacterium]